MKKHLSSISLFLVCMYALYAVSPLSYDTVNIQPNDPANGFNEKERTIKLYALDVILSALLDLREHGPAKNDSSKEDHILLIKKRALRTSLTQLISQLSSQSEKRLDVPPDHENFLNTEPLWGAVSTRPNGYQFLHSGASPPST